jgi:IS1 family transposase
LWGQKNKIWLWTAVDHFKPGILGWVLGDHSAETFKPLWAIVAMWQCYFYVTDGWSVYPGFIPEGDQIVSKTYMTRVEGENTRLILSSSITSQDIVLFQISTNAGAFHSIVTSLPQVPRGPHSSIYHRLIQQRRFLNVR